MTHGLLERPTLCSPDIELSGEPDGRIRVEVNGVDYDEESFFVRHAYFLGANDPYQALKTTLEAEVDREWWSWAHSANGRAALLVFPRRIAMVALSVGSYALARGVARFKEGARHIALVLLYLGALGSAASILTPAEPGESGAAFSLLLQVAFIHYFHTRRSLFGDRGSPPKRRIAIF